MTRISLSASFLTIICFGAGNDGTTAEQIMGKVADNQERSIAARNKWTHHQDLLVRLTRSNGKLVRQEHREYSVLPSAEGIQKILLPPGAGKSRQEGMDAELLDDLVDDFGSDNKSKDGIRPEFFPLTRAEQAKYDFKLAGKETYRDRAVWKVLFSPAKNRGDAIWSGEALIDTSEYQPVLVTTKLAHNIPMPVRILLGTNIGYLGFKISYRRLEEGVWMPETYGSEFTLRALFFYSRKIGISLRNSDFRVADVQSRIEYAADTTAR